MLIPYSTDAPIYYWPFATVGLIVANVLAFVLEIALVQEGDYDTLASLFLCYGEGVYPWQWVTSMFMHAGIMHLVGNMIFLWCFGLIVEGKIGWWRFLVVYLGIGVLQSAALQIVLLASSEPGRILGASSAIYGIMAMALVWAPKNELSCFYWIARPGTADISIVFFAMFYVFFDVFEMVITGLQVSTGMLHVSGGVLGFIAGVVMLKQHWVDCEGYDLFNTIGGDHPREPDYKAIDAKVAERKKKVASQDQQQAIASLENMVREGHAQGALVLYNKLRDIDPTFELTRPRLAEFVKQLHAKQLFCESVPLMQDWIKRFPETADGARLKLAQICVTSVERPITAIEMLNQIDSAKQPAEKRAIAKQILAKARKMEAEGVVELDT